jgi:enamine deaminase RidA (YjgF/YER057c/UK114 family)
MRQLIDSGTATERLAAYSRAVVDGEWVFVSGTIGVDPVTGELPTGAGPQAEAAFLTVEAALAAGGAALTDVVRCRVFLTSREDLPEVAAILKRKFADIRPANTTVICQLPVPAARVEIEITARLRSRVDAHAQR